MDRNYKRHKRPVAEDIIFRYMMLTVFGVSSIFFVRNLIGGAWRGAITIGVCLAIFSFVMIGVRQFNPNQETQQLIICISIVVVVFCISLNSGDYYSDDFPIYLAVVGICGLYLNPKLTLIQGGLIDVALLVSYAIHPEKADPFPQFCMCILVFSVAVFTFYMVIKRGRIYIEIGEQRALEAEALLERIKSTGVSLQDSCQESMDRISGLEETNHLLEKSRMELQKGSDIISRDSEEMTRAFDSVHEQMQATQEQMSGLNQEVKQVEDSMDVSNEKLQEMALEIDGLKISLEDTFHVFHDLQEEITQISSITGQLNKIANETTMLALNASIEAARAGASGSGFAVVAAKVQDLAVDSNQCAGGVVTIVESMQERIAHTVNQLNGAAEAIGHSVVSLKELGGSFDVLSDQFGDLYTGIEEQSVNLRQMDRVFGDLRRKIEDMAFSSESNQNAVKVIQDSIGLYRSSIHEVIEVNQNIRNLSEEMIKVSSEESR